MSGPAYILTGAKPSDLLVVQLTQFKPVTNLRTARVIGLDPTSDLISLPAKRRAGG